MSADRRRTVLLALAAIFTAAVGMLLYAGGVLGTLELSSIDARFSIRGPQRAPPKIVIVGIDDHTIAALRGGELTTVPRGDEATVIDDLRSAGARLIGVDLELIGQTAADTAWRTAVAQARGHIVLGTLNNIGANLVVGWEDHMGDFHSLAAGAPLGVAEVPLDSDGVVRRFHYSYSGWHSLAVVLAKVYSHHAVPRSEFQGNSAPIDFIGPPGSFSTISFVQVLDQQFPRGFFAGKIVLIGDTAPLLHDELPTAVSGSGEMSGVEIWANALWTLLRGVPLRFAPGALNLLLIVLAAIVVPLARLRLRATLTVILALGLAALYTVVTQLAFDGGTILSFTYPLASLALGTMSSNALEAVLEQRRRKALETELDRLPSDRSDFFICYRRDQASWPADALAKELRSRFGEGSVFKDDSQSIAYGESFPTRLDEAIRSCSVMLVLIGPFWLEARDGVRRIDDPNDWVRREIETGLAADCVVVPVLLDGAEVPRAEQLPSSLAALAACNAIVLAPDNWQAKLDELVSSVRQGRIREFLAAERTARQAEADVSTAPQ